MIDQFLTNLARMTPLQIAENGAFFVLLILALFCFARNSSAFNRLFIPAVCIMACCIRLVHWAEHGDEPRFLTPVVRVFASMFMG